MCHKKCAEKIPANLEILRKESKWLDIECDYIDSEAVKDQCNAIYLLILSSGLLFCSCLDTLGMFGSLYFFGLIVICTILSQDQISGIHFLKNTSTFLFIIHMIRPQCSHLIQYIVIIAHNSMMPIKIMSILKSPDLHHQRPPIDPSRFEKSLLLA